MRTRFLISAISVLIFFFIGCTPTSLSTVPTEKSERWDDDAYDSLKQKWTVMYKEQGSDTLSYRAYRTLRKLFKESIDQRNTTPDYQASFEYATILSQKSARQSSEYRDWVVVLEWVVDKNNVATRLQRENNRLKRSKRKNTNYTKRIEKQKETVTKELTALQKEHKELQETVEKLKQLELLMEQERRSR